MRHRPLTEADVYGRCYAWVFENDSQPETDNVKDIMNYLQRWVDTGSIKFDKPKRILELSRALSSLGAQWKGRP